MSKGSYADHVNKETEISRDPSRMGDYAVIKHYCEKTTDAAKNKDRIIAVYESGEETSTHSTDFTPPDGDEEASGMFLLWLFAHWLKTGSNTARVRIIMEHGKQKAWSQQRQFHAEAPVETLENMKREDEQGA